MGAKEVVLYYVMKQSFYKPRRRVSYGKRYGTGTCIPLTSLPIPICMRKRI